MEFARKLNLPAHAPSPRAQDLQIAAARNDLAARTDAPVEGDAVLMELAGARRRRGYHLGVFVAGDEPHVLHLPRDGSSIVHPVRELALHDLELEGYYRWNG